MLLNNLFSHIGTIVSHRSHVLHLCIRCGITGQGLVHDLSKYMPSEFIAGVKYFSYGYSPNEAERLHYGYSAAWLHHKGRNKHHSSYWLDYCPVTQTITPIRMPIKYVAEMFCDRVAASKTYQRKRYTNASSYEFFLKEKDAIIMHPATKQLLEEMLSLLAERGERAACRYIRRLVRKPGLYDYNDIRAEGMLVYAASSKTLLTEAGAEALHGEHIEYEDPLVIRSDLYADIVEEAIAQEKMPPAEPDRPRVIYIGDIIAKRRRAAYASGTGSVSEHSSSEYSISLPEQTDEEDEMPVVVTE